MGQTDSRMRYGVVGGGGESGVAAVAAVAAAVAAEMAAGAETCGMSMWTRVVGLRNECLSRRRTGHLCALGPLAGC